MFYVFITRSDRSFFASNVISALRVADCLKILEEKTREEACNFTQRYLCENTRRKKRSKALFWLKKRYFIRKTT